MAIQKTDINPATGQPYAVNPATGVWDDTYWSEVVEPSLGMGGGSPEQMAQQMIDAMMAPYKEALDRASQFEKDNPFFFDEEMARASASERFDPYYNAELNDFISGIERTRQRSVQDEQKVLTELTAQTEDYLGRTKRQLDQAIRASEEGMAGAGLFFSGDRLRRTGEKEVEAGQQRRTFLRGQELSEGEARLGRLRTEEDLGAQERTYRRQWGAERETALQTDTEKQKQEEKTRYELERQQFIGYPLSGGSDSFLNMASYL